MCLRYPFLPKSVRATSPSLRETTRRDYLLQAPSDALPSLRLRKRERH
jgi:hypothetical protein